jgi:hypothetical protein
MPEVRIVAHPVFPEQVVQGYWWARPRTAMLIFAEYQKYLLSLVRPMIFGQPDPGSEPS